MFWVGSILKANPGKFQLMVLGTAKTKLKVILLGIKIDKKLRFTLKNYAKRPVSNYVRCVEVEIINSWKNDVSS